MYLRVYKKKKKEIKEIYSFFFIRKRKKYIVTIILSSIFHYRNEGSFYFWKECLRGNTEEWIDIVTTKSGC